MGEGVKDILIVDLVQFLLDGTAATLVEGQELNFSNHLVLVFGKVNELSLLSHWSWGLDEGVILHHALLWWHHLEVTWINNVASWLEDWSAGVHHELIWSHLVLGKHLCS